jgi:trk system potassium uptake protein TrkH
MSLARRLEPLSAAVRMRVVLKHGGTLCLALAALTVVPAVVSLLVGDLAFAWHCTLPVLFLVALGWPLARLSTPPQLLLNEALVVLALGFVLGSLLLAYPLMRAGLSPMDAWFESVSALTTTGLSTLARVEGRSPAFLFTRAWMQWYGGLGFVVFSIVLLLLQPGMAARRLVIGEVEADNRFGSSRAYARSVLAAYTVLTGLGIAALWLLGAQPFAALLFCLSAVSTGGFAPYDNSLLGLGAWPIQAAVMGLALAGAVSLPLYGQALRRGWPAVAANLELRALLAAAALTSVVLALFLLRSGQWGWREVLAHAPLMGVSAQTGAGFSSLPVAELDAPAKLLLIVSMCIGGSTGSTAGGIKLLRLLIAARMLQLLVLRTRLPRHAVVGPELGSEPLEGREVEGALLVILLFALCITLSWLPFLMAGYDPLSALFEVVSATATVGLSTGITAPELEAFLKAVLCADMLLGRVELLALLVVLYPGTWSVRRRVVR